MQTIYDWMTVAAFAALIVLFLQRSVADDPPDRIWQYLPPAVGCAAANYAGNEGYGLLAVVILCASAAYVYYVLKPGRLR
jgi:hypothetical protein